MLGWCGAEGKRVCVPTPGSQPDVDTLVALPAGREWVDMTPWARARPGRRAPLRSHRPWGIEADVPVDTAETQGAPSEESYRQCPHLLGARQWLLVQAHCPRAPAPLKQRDGVVRTPHLKGRDRPPTHLPRDASCCVRKPKARSQSENIFEDGLLSETSELLTSPCLGAVSGTAWSAVGQSGLEGATQGCSPAMCPVHVETGPPCDMLARFARPRARTQRGSPRDGTLRRRKRE